MMLRAMRTAAAALLLSALLAPAGAALAHPGHAREWDGTARLEVREVRLFRSDCGLMCWFSAVLRSDFGCDGERSPWHDARLSGLLETDSGVVRLYVSLAAEDADGAVPRIAY